MSRPRAAKLPSREPPAERMPAASRRKHERRSPTPPREPEAEALLRIARAIGTLDLDAVVSRASAMTASALRASRAVIYLVSVDGRGLELVSTNRDGQRPQHWPLESVGPITASVLKTGRPVVVRDYREDPRRRKETTASLRLRSFIAVPIEVGRERLGCLHVGEPRRLRAFSRRDVDLAIGIGSLIAVAVKNARLAREGATRLELLRRLSARLFTVQEDERRRIARELHDEAGQALTAMKLNLDLARRELPPGRPMERLAEVSRLAHEVLEELRRIARDLRPRALDELGLVPALKVLADTFRDRAGIDLDLSLDPEIRLDEVSASTAFRFVQESLTNVMLHAHARAVRVHARRRAKRVVFEVEDDGIGFDGAETRGMGLVGMRERAEFAGGEVAIRSRPGRGTVIRLSLPAGEADRSGRA